MKSFKDKRLKKLLGTQQVNKSPFPPKNPTHRLKDLIIGKKVKTVAVQNKHKKSSLSADVVPTSHDEGSAGDDKNGGKGASKNDTSIQESSNSNNKAGVRRILFHRSEKECIISQCSDAYDSMKWSKIIAVLKNSFKTIPPNVKAMLKELFRRFPGSPALQHHLTTTKSLKRARWPQEQVDWLRGFMSLIRARKFLRISQLMAQEADKRQDESWRKSRFMIRVFVNGKGWLDDETDPAGGAGLPWTKELLEYLVEHSRYLTCRPQDLSGIRKLMKEESIRRNDSSWDRGKLAIDNIWRMSDGLPGVLKRIKDLERAELGYAGSR